MVTTNVIGQFIEGTACQRVKYKREQKENGNITIEKKGISNKINKKLRKGCFYARSTTSFYINS